MKYALFCLFLILGADVFADGTACTKDMSSSSPLLNTALHNLAGLKYVHDALASLPADVEFCISGVVLAQDIYQYSQFYIQSDVRTTKDHVLLYQMRFLFQDASTQALQNMVVQPWTALKLIQTNSILSSAFQGLTPAPAPLNSSDAVAVAQTTATYTTSTAQPATLMAMPLGPMLGLQNVNLVTWLTLPSTDLFASTPQTKGVLVGQNDQGQSMVVENLWPYSSLLLPMSQSLSASQPQSGSDLKQTLLNYSLEMDASAN